MTVKKLLNQILVNESLTRGLGDSEARILVEWLVDRAEKVAERAPSEDFAQKAVQQLCLRGRAISRFVALWCYEDGWPAACQLAATERFHWPLPATFQEPCDLMHSIVQWETSRLAAA